MNDAHDTKFEEAARRVMERCDSLAACSDDADGITRLFLSPSMHTAHDLVGMSFVREPALPAWWIIFVMED